MSEVGLAVRFDRGVPGEDARVDQGSAAVWSAGLGVFGTLIGALGGAYLQRGAALKQVREQEAADVRHRLRDERRAAFADVLIRCDAVGVRLNEIAEARARPDWPAADAGHELTERQQELWAPADAALRELRQATWTVAVTGPDSMAQLAAELHEANATRVALALRSTDTWENVRAELLESRGHFDHVRRKFIAGAQAVLSSSENGQPSPPGRRV